MSHFEYQFISRQNIIDEKAKWLFENRNILWESISDGNSICDLNMTKVNWKAISNISYSNIDWKETSIWKPNQDFAWDFDLDIKKQQPIYPPVNEPLTMADIPNAPSPSSTNSVISINDPIANMLNLNDLLAAINFTNGAPFCATCDSQAAARCRECSIFLCNPCVQTHLSLSRSQDHEVVRLNNGYKLRADSLGYNSGSSATESPPPGHALQAIQPAQPGQAINLICDTHKEPHTLYCGTCHVSGCTECIAQYHSGHHLNLLEEAIEEASQNSFKLANEVKSALAAVNGALQGVLKKAGDIDWRLYQASVDVKTTVKSCVEALERRGDELVSRINLIRRTKENHLRTQLENLRMALVKLFCIDETLQKSLQSSNVLDMIQANQKAFNELRGVRVIQNELMPCEDDNIYFIPPESDLFRALYNMGTINANINIPPIMRAREFGTIPEGFALFPDIFAPSRPLYGARGLVCIKDNGPNPLFTFGIEGSRDGQFCRPWGVCCNHLGHIIVADRSNNRIQVFNADGKFLYKFGSRGPLPGQFERPAGITVNPSGDLVIADKDNHRIQIFKMDGTFVLSFGRKGTANGEFNYPWDVACNSQSQIAVTDTRNHRLQLFTSEGQFISKYGFDTSHPTWKNFDSPRSVAFAPSGQVIVTDFNNHRLVILDKYLTKAQYIGCEGPQIKQFNRPQGVICDDQGRIIVADSRNHRIQVFDLHGSYIFRFGKPGRSAGEFDRPTGLALNPDGRLVVVDFGNTRVQVF